MNAVPKAAEEKKAVGIWIRVSTEDRARGESPEHHEKRARAYPNSLALHETPRNCLNSLTSSASTTVISYPWEKR